MKYRTIWLLALLIAALGGTPFASAAEPDAAAAQCESLTGGRFVDLPGAPTWIIKATFHAAEGSTRAFCAVDGYVNPTVGIGMYLPAAGWNGKFIERGCGGSCGSVAVDMLCSRHLRDGYACITTDMGHRSDQIDNNWVANNLQGVVDFGYRSAHVTAVAGKAILAAYYGRAQDRAYFYGCSTGGRQALIEAQRFPADFDGIVAVAPASLGPFGSRALPGPTAANRGADKKEILPDSKVPIIYKAVIAKCDLNDGVADGLVDPRDCQFDPAQLTCKGADRPDCLTDAQVAVARAFYNKAAVGSELNWINNWTAPPGPPVEFAQSRGDPALIETLDYAANPDLNPFKARGGKLILTHGSTDLIVPANPTTAYYELATRAMGGPEATRALFRFFVIPGMDHCSGGDGAWGVDYVAALDAWVDQGKAPDRLIGVAPKLGVVLDYYGVDSRLLSRDQIAFSRPYFPYPLRSYYRGSGDPNHADSFVAGAAPPRGMKPAKATPSTISSAAQLAETIRVLITLSEETYAKGVTLPPKNVSDRIAKAMRRTIYASGMSDDSVREALRLLKDGKLSAIAVAAVTSLQREFGI